MDFDIVSYLLGKKRGGGSIGVKYEVVEELPTTGEEGVIYLVPKSTSKTDNVYNEYMYINNNWELIGDTEADLTNYVKNTDYANDSTAGVIKTSSNYATNMTDGVLYARTRNYSEYTSAQNGAFIGKGTLEAVITGKGLVNSTDLATKQDIMQYSTLPTASQDNLGKILQYTGTTDSTYTNGYFYQCVSDGESTPTYSWENINVQTASSGGDGIKIFATRDIDLRNDVEPGIYVTESDTNKMRIYDLEGTLNQISMGWGFFYVIKKYSEVAVDEYFIYYHDPTGNNCRLKKTNDAKGISTSPTMGSGMWADRENYLKKDNTVSFTPSGKYNPSTKLYTDKTHYENMSGYDATKTQVLKNINGTLTWVDEV